MRRICSPSVVALSLLTLLSLPAVAVAQPVPPPPAVPRPEPPTPRVDIEGSFGVAVLRIDPGSETADLATLASLGLGAAYVTRSGLALVAHVQAAHGAASCAADGPCYEPVYDRVLLVDAGLRWMTGSRSYAQAAALLGRTSHDYDGFVVSYTAAGAALALGWRRPLAARGFVGFELRVLGWRADPTDGGDRRMVLGGGVALTLGTAP